MLVKKPLDNILSRKVNRSGAHSSDAPKESAVFCARTSIKTMINREQLETQIQEKNLNAPRITPDVVNNLIDYTDYYIFPNTTLTVCCIHLKNGFTVTGESACASPENFNEEIGRNAAFAKAKDKIWELEGYRLRCMLASQQK